MRVYVLLLVLIRLADRTVLTVALMLQCCVCRRLTDKTAYEMGYQIHVTDDVT